jgi:hypothetical protein
VLDRYLKSIIDAQLAYAIDSIERPYGARVEFEAGRRQGVYQGLSLARQKIEEQIRGDSEDEISGSEKSAAIVRRVG